MTKIQNSKLDGIEKGWILAFFWIPASAGMTIRELISDRDKSCHTREGGYPVVKMDFYDFIKLICEFEKLTSQQ
jgi:hypothetical protein